MKKEINGTKKSSVTLVADDFFLHKSIALQKLPQYGYNEKKNYKLNYLYVIIAMIFLEVKRMLNNDKIRVMTKLAIYESGKGKEDIKLSQYFKKDYIRLQTLNTVVFSTIGYGLILLLIGVYQSEYLIAEAVNLEYKSIGMYILGLYVMTLTVYILATIIGSTLKYDASRKKLAGYNRGLKHLSKIYEEEEK